MHDRQKRCLCPQGVTTGYIVANWTGPHQALDASLLRMEQIADFSAAIRLGQADDGYCTIAKPLENECKAFAQALIPRRIKKVGVCNHKRFEIFGKNDVLAVARFRQLPGVL
jgi:hypothetical protein